MTSRECTLVPASPAYPRALLALERPPAALYCRGNLGLFALPCVAIVGTRAPTELGEGRARALAQYLAAHQVVVLSGLAVGIDAAAHRGALSARGYTVAVLGTPLDLCYPKEHRSLQADIGEQGLLVTEYGDRRFAPWRFRHRDRIQVALAQVVVAIETGVTNSNGRPAGTMHTVRDALGLGRPVWVPSVPGHLASLNQYEGIRKLVEQGLARPFGDDAFDELVACARRRFEAQGSAPATG